jgi:hypothetical protein
VLHHVADGELGRVGDEEVNMIGSHLPGEDADIDLGTESTDEGPTGLYILRRVLSWSVKQRLNTWQMQLQRSTLV